MTIPNRTIFIRDNLEVMRGINSESIDLIYLDPPFNKGVTFSAPIGSRAAGAEFKDAWTLDDVKEEWVEEIEEENPGLHHAIIAAGFAHSDSMQGYLTYMAIRLMEIHRILKPTGSVYLHCDQTASHYLKEVLDTVFGSDRFKAEITWKRTTSHNDVKRNYSAVGDIIFFYIKGNDFTFHTQYVPYSEDYLKKFYRYLDGNGRRYRLNNMRSPSPRPNLTYEYRGYKPHPNGWTVSLDRMKQLDAEGRLHFPKSKEGRLSSKLFLDEMPGVPVGNIWDDIKPISSHAKERLGYPTQKPLVLLERIIRASSNPGDLLFDPFCGCATSLVAAEKLGRQWIGVDISPRAYDLVVQRLAKEVSIGADEHPVAIERGRVDRRDDIPTRTDIGVRRPSKGIKNILYGWQEGNCKGCGEHFPIRNLTIDHIVPRSKGGANADGNLQLLCGACNSVKGNRSQAELMAALHRQGVTK